MRSIEINPTIVPSAFADIADVSARYAPFASFFQIDVADGVFAPNTTWLPKEGDRLPEAYSYEVHLMVSDPRAVGNVFAGAGARRIIAHTEALKGASDARLMFEVWKKEGVETVGVAALLQTPFTDIEPYVAIADFVLLMTIARIGVQGIPFEESSIERVAEFARLHSTTPVAVDGGVSEKNIERLTRAGVSRFGVGSAIAQASDPGLAYTHLKALAEKATLS